MNRDYRRAKMYMGNWGVTFLYRTKPTVIAWWSAALPGFGHMQLGMHIKGILLMSAEIILNFMGNINLAIFHTFNLQWELARDVMHLDYAFLYVSIWIFSIINS